MKQALTIVLTKADKRIETAVTYTNLAASQLQLGEFTEAVDNLKKAFSIFDMDEEKDFHYGGALAAYAQAQYLMGNPEEAKPLFKRAMLYGGKDSPVILDHYAEVLYALEEYDMAFIYWKMATQKNNGQIPDLEEKISQKKEAVKK